MNGYHSNRLAVMRIPEEMGACDENAEGVEGF